jgi:hypothetical protein
MPLNSLLLAIALLPSPGQGYLAPLEIRLVAPKTRILAGEPVRLTAIWSVTEPIQVMFDRTRVRLDSGSGFEEWHEAARPINELPTVLAYQLAPGAPGASTHVVGVGRQPAIGRADALSLAMPTPGPYRVTLQYGNSEGIVSSNVVSINARAPIARNLELFERHIRPFPVLVSGHAGQLVERIDRLIDAYSPTPYLARSYVLMMRSKLIRAIQEAPDGYPVQGEVPALLEKLAKGTLGNSAFDEDRLIVLAEMYERSGRREDAFATLREIAQRYPDGEAAWKARWRLGDPAPRIER